LADVAAKEFDHEFAGKLIITRANREELDRFCAGALPSGRKIACAAVPAPGATECRIYIGDDAVLAGAGSSFEETVRHERGHCNGWSEAHERARSMREVLASEGKPVPTLKVCTLMVFGVPTFIPVLCVS
jgi:hypothetical protein